MRLHTILFLTVAAVSSTLLTGCPQVASPEDGSFVAASADPSSRPRDAENEASTSESSAADKIKPAYDATDVTQTTSADSSTNRPDGYQDSIGASGGDAGSGGAAGAQPDDDDGTSQIDNADSGPKDGTDVDPNDGGGNDPKDGDDSDPNDLDLEVDDPNHVDPNQVDPNDDDPNDTDPNTPDPNQPDPNAVDPNDADPNALDPNSPDGNPTGFHGVFADTVAFDRVIVSEFFSEDPSHDVIHQPVRVEFDDAGLPVTLTVPSYQPYGTQEFLEMPFGPVGTEQLFESTTYPHGDTAYVAEVLIRIDTVSLADGVGEVTMSILHRSSAGGRSEEGPGTHTVRFQMGANGLAYESTTFYDLIVRAGVSLEFWLTQQLSTSVTLPPE